MKKTTELPKRRVNAAISLVVLSILATTNCNINIDIIGYSLSKPLEYVESVLDLPASPYETRSDRTESSENISANRLL